MSRRALAGLAMPLRPPSSFSDRRANQSVSRWLSRHLPSQFAVPGGEEGDCGRVAGERGAMIASVERCRAQAYSKRNVKANGAGSFLLTGAYLWASTATDGGGRGLRRFPAGR